jgi:hypothetical protein
MATGNTKHSARYLGLETTGRGSTVGMCFLRLRFALIAIHSTIIIIMNAISKYVMGIRDWGKKKKKKCMIIGYNYM